MLKIAPLFLTTLLLCQPAAAQTEREPRSITVFGTATIRVVPDEVVVSLSVESLNKDLRQAKADNDVRAQKVLAITKDFKIEPRNVQTTEVSLYPRWHQTGDQREFLGYRAANQIRVTLQDMARYDEFVARAIEAGDVLLSGVEFNCSQAAAKRSEARKMALQAAREKARAMAAELDQKIGMPLSIKEEQVFGDGGNAYGLQVQTSVTEGDDARDDVTTLAPGQIEISARVSVRFELQ